MSRQLDAQEIKERIDELDLDYLSEKDFISVIGHIINIKYPENKDVCIDKYYDGKITIKVGYSNRDN